MTNMRPTICTLYTGHEIIPKKGICDLYSVCGLHRAQIALQVHSTFHNQSFCFLLSGAQIYVNIVLYLTGICLVSVFKYPKTISVLHTVHRAGYANYFLTHQTLQWCNCRFFFRSVLNVIIVNSVNVQCQLFSFNNNIKLFMWGSRFILFPILVNKKYWYRTFCNVELILPEKKETMNDVTLI